MKAFLLAVLATVVITPGDIGPGDIGASREEPMAGRISYNPYAGVNWATDERAVTQLHDHVQDDEPSWDAYDDVVDGGYDAVSLLHYSGDQVALPSSWDGVAWPATTRLSSGFIATLDVLILPGVEFIGSQHMTNTWQETYMELGVGFNTTQGAVDEIIAEGGFPSLAHPWSGVNPHIPNRINMIEVCSAGAEKKVWDSSNPNAVTQLEDYWVDNYLDRERRVFAVCVNDWVGPFDATPGLPAAIKDSGKQIVLTPTIDLANMESRMRQGAMFAIRDKGATKGGWPVISEITYIANTITIAATGHTSVKWLSTGGKTVSTSLTVDLASDLLVSDRYVRAELENADGSRVWTQPWEVNGKSWDKETYAAACSDGLDNDNDLLTDFPNDFGCTSSEDDDEQFQAATRGECNDGIDNDGWGDVDGADPGCERDKSDRSEYVRVEGDPECDDGVDNDGDTLVDVDDPGCSSATDDDEANVAAACSDGIDNDGDGAIDLADLECVDGTDTSELWTPPGLSVGTTITIAADLGANIQSDVGPWRAVHWDARDAISTTSASGTGDAGETNDMRVLFCYWSFGSSMGSSPLGARGIPENKWWGPCGNISSGHLAEVDAGNSVDTVYVTVVDLVDDSYKIGGPYSITTVDPLVEYSDANTACVSTSASFPNCPAGVTDKENHGTDFDAMCNDEFVTEGNTLVLVEPGAWVSSEDCNDIDDDHSIIGLGTWDVDVAAQRVSLLTARGSNTTMIRGTNSTAGADNIRIDNFAFYNPDSELSGGSTPQLHSMIGLGKGNVGPTVSRLYGVGFTSLGGGGDGGIDTDVDPDSTEYAWIHSSYSLPNCSNQGSGGSGSNGIYSDAVLRGTLLGISGDRGCHPTNSSVASPTTKSYLEHAFRVQHWRDGVVRGLTTTSWGVGKHALGFRGDEHNTVSGTGNGTDEQTLGWSIVDSVFGGSVQADGSASTMLQVGPQNGIPGQKSEQEEIGHGLIYGNKFAYDEGVETNVQLVGDFAVFSTTISGNLTIWQATSQPSAGNAYWQIRKRDNGAQHPVDIDLDDNWVVYNTFYSEETSPVLAMVRHIDCGATTSGVIANNMLVNNAASSFPTSTGTCMGTDSDNIYDDDTSIVSTADFDWTDYYTTASPTPTVSVYGGWFDVDAGAFTDAAGINQP